MDHHPTRESRHARAVVVLALSALAADAAKGSEQSTTASQSRSIYRCVVAGIATFSDRPCGHTIQAYEPPLARFSTLESVAPAPVVIAKAQSGASSRAARTSKASRLEGAGSARTHADQCLRLQQSLRKISSRMRAGYSVSEGERLRSQKKSLDAKRRNQRCA